MTSNISDLNNRRGMTMVCTSDQHELFDEILLLFIVHIDAFGFEFLEGSVDNFNTAFDDKSSGIDLGLCLLNEEQALCNFGMICHLHDFHSFDSHSADVAPILQKPRHVVSNK